MPWRWPRWLPTAGGPLNVDDVYDASQPYVEELAGRLNEHNFKSGVFNSRTDLQDGAVVRYWVKQDAVDPDYANDVPAQPGTRLQSSRRWEVIPTDGMTSPPTDFLRRDDVTTGRGRLWVTASFQVFQIDDTTGEVMQDSYNDLSPSMWAIRVDGVVIMAGACGEDQGYTLGTTRKDPGLLNACDPVVVEAIIDIDPGTHVVDVVGLVALHDIGGSNDGHPEVYNHSLIIRELRA